MLFFRILKDGARHCTRYLGLDPPLDLNIHTGTAGTGSDILNTNHMVPNPVGPFTYPLPLYVWSEPMYGFLRDIHRCFLYALVHGCRLPRTIQKPFRCIAGMHSLKERPMKSKRGHSIILMNFPMDSVSKSPQE